MFSVARMSSPKWMALRPSSFAYALYTASPPGKERCWLPELVCCTSHGSSLDVTLMTVSKLPLTNWPECAGKASIDSYGAPTSSANARRFIMLSLQVTARSAPDFPLEPSVTPVAKNLVLHPAT